MNYAKLLLLFNKWVKLHNVQLGQKKDIIFKNWLKETHEINNYGNKK